MNIRKLAKWILVLAAIAAVKQIDGLNSALSGDAEYVTTTRSGTVK